MISSDHGDFVAPLGASEKGRRCDLSEFDGQRVTIILSHHRQRVVLQGTATFQRDDALGNALNIQLDADEPGQPVLIISEDEWGGRIVPDFHHGCEFALILD